MMERMIQSEMAYRVRRYNNAAKTIADAVVNGETVSPAMIEAYQAAGALVDEGVALLAAQRQA